MPDAAAPICERCGYNLQGLEMPRPCPECGLPLGPRGNREAVVEWFATWHGWLLRRPPAGLLKHMEDERVVAACRRRARLWRTSFLAFCGCAAIATLIGGVPAFQLAAVFGVQHVSILFGTWLSCLAVTGLSGVDDVHANDLAHERIGHALFHWFGWSFSLQFLITSIAVVGFAFSSKGDGYDEPGLSLLAIPLCLLVHVLAAIAIIINSFSATRPPSERVGAVISALFVFGFFQVTIGFFLAWGSMMILLALFDIVDRVS